MSRSRWTELLGLAEEVRQPNLYQLLGVDEHDFSAGEIEAAFRERMQRIQSLRSTKHKEFLEFVKGELRRALRVLTSSEERRAYDQELRSDREVELRRILVPTLAAGVLVGAAEKALLATAVLELGMRETDALSVIDAELIRSGAVRIDAPTLGAIPASEGLRLEAIAELAAQQAAALAELADAARLRAAEAARMADAAEEAKRERKKSGRRKKPKSGRVKVVKVKASPAELQPLEPLPSVEPLPRAVLSVVKFCAHCGGSIPEHWKKTGQAERVGARLLCSSCSAPIRAGRACAGCSKEFATGEKAHTAGGSKRICVKCAEGAQRMKVCSSCEVIIPRNDFIERGGKFFCFECAE